MDRFELIAALLGTGMSARQVLDTLVRSMTNAQVLDELEFIAVQWGIELP